jgi:hypothetical protein
MIVEQRTYTLHVGKIPEFLRLYETEGLPIQTRILGRLIGFFTTEIGPLNQVVHLWGYESLDDRARRRAEMVADPAWKALAPNILPMIQVQESKILNPAPFSPIR